MAIGAKALVLAVILSILLAGAVAIPYFATAGNGELDESAASDAFQAYKRQFKKIFKNDDDEMFRYSIFKSNLALIAKHNADFKAGKSSFWMEVNHLADLTDDEYRKMLGFRRKEKGFVFDTAACTHTNITPNVTVDWRILGAVTEVKDQGQCGSCWTFSATGAIEGSWFVSQQKLLSLSEEEILQCDISTDDQGCDGGDMDSAFAWVIKNGGLATEAEYPYVSGAGVTGKCVGKRLKLKEARISAVCDVVPGDEGDLERAVAQQPVAVGIEADQKAFQFYGGGVLPAHKCGVKLDHGVTTVGYGHDAKHGMDYWTVKNSWGDMWGESGYIRLQKFPTTGNHSTCGIAMAASYPIV